MEQSFSREFDCEFERHGKELHLILNSEEEAIEALPAPPGRWIRHENRLILTRRKKRTKKLSAVNPRG